MKKMVVVSEDRLKENLAFWEQKRKEQYAKPEDERDYMQIGIYDGHIAELNGIINKYSVEIV